MGMTFLQQQNKLSRILGDPNSSTDDMWPATDRQFEINRGEVKFAEKSKSLFGLITGTVASQKISLPSGFLGIHQLVVNYINMTGKMEMPLQDYDRYIASGDDKYYFWVTAGGVRQLNFIDANSNGLTYSLWYFKKPIVDLSGDTDESPFEDEFREASVYYAAGELLPQSGKFQLADYYKSEFKRVSEEAKAVTEALFLNSQRPFPDIGNRHQYDKDIQGIGTQYGAEGFN